MSLIYPIARGTAPVFVLVAGAIVLGQAVALVAAVGIAVVATGVLLVRGVRSPASLRHVALALAIAGIIASYTLVDTQGLRYADPLPYAVIVTGIPGAVLLAWVLARSGRARVRAVLTPGIVAASLCGIVAYGFVLGALAIAPAAAMVSAVRETSVVMATALAALVLHERVARSRWIGAIVVTAGVVLVVLG
jgi:drug/metabolite transporter (DMT)-like permease